MRRRTPVRSDPKSPGSSADHGKRLAVHRLRDDRRKSKKRVRPGRHDRSRRGLRLDRFEEDRPWSWRTLAERHRQDPPGGADTDEWMVAVDDRPALEVEAAPERQRLAGDERLALGGALDDRPPDDHALPQRLVPDDPAFDRGLDAISQAAEGDARYRAGWARNTRIWRSWSSAS